MSNLTTSRTTGDQPEVKLDVPNSSQTLLNVNTVQLNKSRQEHQFQIEDKRLAAELRDSNIRSDNVYESCCLIIDRRAVVFFTQLILSIFVLAFSCWNLSLTIVDPCSKKTDVYIGLLTLMLGWWAPSPSLQ